jgi:hypothetical protein
MNVRQCRARLAKKQRHVSFRSTPLCIPHKLKQTFPDNTLHTWRNSNLYPSMSELETIIQRWIRDEGLSREEAREMAINEIDFYTEESPAWKGPNDSTQEYI